MVALRKSAERKGAEGSVAMSYEADTKTNQVDGGADVLAASGVRFVHVLRDVALDSGAPAGLRGDWNIITEWLSCSDGKLSAEQDERIAGAWRAYLAMGVAPSFALQEAFDSAHHKCKCSGFDVNENRAPARVMDVFDRLLATDEEIAKKRKYDRDVERLKLEAILGNRKEKAGIRAKLDSSSRNTRIAITASAVWIAWVTFRTAGSYEFLGFYLRRWDVDMFVVNILAPIVVTFALFKAYKWIAGAKR